MNSSPKYWDRAPGESQELPPSAQFCHFHPERSSSGPACSHAVLVSYRTPFFDYISLQPCPISALSPPFSAEHNVSQRVNACENPCLTMALLTRANVCAWARGDACTFIPVSVLFSRSGRGSCTFKAEISMVYASSVWSGSLIIGFRLLMVS
jgi:hypothetical protein